MIKTVAIAEMRGGGGKDDECFWPEHLERRSCLAAGMETYIVGRGGFFGRWGGGDVSVLDILGFKIPLDIQSRVIKQAVGHINLEFRWELWELWAYKWYFKPRDWVKSPKVAVIDREKNSSRIALWSPPAVRVGRETREQLVRQEES